MSFKVSGALFQQPIEKVKQRLKERFDPDKNYPQYDGVLNVPADQAFELAKYLMEGKPVGDRQEIPVQISGWKRQSQGGQPYLSLQFGPHYKYEAVAADATVASAKSLATATSGTVIDEDDIPF